MVSPPPGVSSADRVPPIASVRPRATARPRPTPSPARCVAGALERREDLVLGLVGHARAAVDDPDLHPVARRARPATTTSRRPGGSGAGRSRGCCASTRSSRPASARTSGGPASRPGRTRSGVRHGGRGRRRRRPRGRRSPRCGVTLPVCSRDMSSRLPMRTSSRSADSSMDSSSSRLVLGRERHVGLAQAGDRRLDPGQRGAQVVRHRCQAARCARGCPGPGRAASRRPRRRRRSRREQARRRARRTRRRGAGRRRAGPGPTSTSSVVVVDGLARTRGVAGCRRARSRAGGGHARVHGSRIVRRGARGRRRACRTSSAACSSRARQRVGLARAGTGPARRGPRTRAAPPSACSRAARGAVHDRAPPRPRRGRTRPGPTRSAGSGWSACRSGR